MLQETATGADESFQMTLLMSFFHQSRGKDGGKEMKHRMKSLIIYDSIYGNTEKIAQAIGEGLTGEVKVVRVGEVR